MALNPKHEIMAACTTAAKWTFHCRTVLPCSISIDSRTSDISSCKQSAEAKLESKVKTGDEEVRGIRRRDTILGALGLYGCVAWAKPAIAAVSDKDRSKPPDAAVGPSNNSNSSSSNTTNSSKKPVSRIYDASAIGEPMAIGRDRDRVWNRLLAARIIYVGEAENVPDPDDKDIELEILQSLLLKSSEQKRSISVGLQAFPSELQPQLDQYMKKGISDDDLRLLVPHWSTQRWKEYQPLLHCCCENEVRLIACGTPLEIMRIVESKGVQGLTQSQRRKYVPTSGSGFIGSSLTLSQRLSIQNIVQQSSSLLPPASYLFAEAQAIEDYTMSQIITGELLDASSVGILIIIAGASHLLLGTRGSGLPARISKKVPKKSQVVILLNPERQHIRKEGEPPVADYLWYAAAKPCIRNCFDRAEIARVMGAASRRRETLPQDIQKGLDLGLVSPELLENFLDLEQTPFVADLIKRFQGFRERWLANPRILQRVVIEESICISATLLAQYRKRKEHFMKELNYVISDSVRSAVVSFFSVWFPAPTLSFISFEENENAVTKSEGIKWLVGSLPDNAFQRNSPGINWDLRARAISVFIGGIKLFFVGFFSSIGTVGISNTLFSVNRQVIQGSKTDGVTVQSPIVKTALIYGCFLGISGNLRYQLVAGIVEHWIADYLLASQPSIGDILSFVARIVNSYFGTQQWIDLARLTGLQQNIEAVKVRNRSFNSFDGNGKKPKLQQNQSEK